MGIMGGGFMGGFGMIFWILIIIGVVFLAIYGLRNTSVEDRDNGRAIREYSAIDIIKSRYARGEISKEEYERIRQDIL